MVGQFSPATGERLQIITRAGVDGTAYRKTGKRAAPSQITTIVDLGSDAAVKSELAAYKALQGTLVTVVTESSGTYTNVAVLAVREVSVRQVLTPVGGVSGGDHLLTCQWVLQMTETS
jgi:hypothetical protein